VGKPGLPRRLRTSSDLRLPPDADGFLSEPITY